ncbi:hypothetical protein VPH35_049080 [Triticum aestivum]|uniref:Bowman-Birk serine protease inhibitors family domain-containing protein n=2 Tax=Triticum TaxID=4564 RepID=A0A9R1Q7H9_TRITD|nr:unnamed protein product [Triticum aestivum]VAH71430.1 unnamed protein product [Triticum turgidum subsp. durum]
MESSVANILLVLSLGAALAVAGRPADTSGEVSAIRLPSDGKGLAGDATVLGAPMKEDERPWACCDDLHCLRVLPRACLCRDTVAQCASACQLRLPGFARRLARPKVHARSGRRRRR